MSAPAFAWAFEMGHQLGLTSSQLLLLLYMADQANCIGSFFTGQGRLAKFTRLDERTIRRLIPQLEELGLIRVETTLGKSTKYHILRQPIGADTTSTQGTTPAQDTTSTQDTKSVVFPPHPGHSVQGPRTLCPKPRTPCPPTLLSTQEEDPKTRASAREARKNSQILKEGKQAADQQLIPEATTPGSDTFNSYLDAPAPTKALPCEIEQEVVHADPLDLPVDPEYVSATVAALRHEWRMRAYPARAPNLAPNEMIDLCENKPQPKPHHLTGAQLAAMRRQAGIHHAADA